MRERIERRAKGGRDGGGRGRGREERETDLDPLIVGNTVRKRHLWPPISIGIIFVSDVSHGASHKQDEDQYQCPLFALLRADAGHAPDGVSGVDEMVLELIYLVCQLSLRCANYTRARTQGPRGGGWSRRSQKSDFSWLDMANDTGLQTCSMPYLYPRRSAAQASSTSTPPSSGSSSSTSQTPHPRQPATAPRRTGTLPAICQWQERSLLLKYTRRCTRRRRRCSRHRSPRHPRACHRRIQQGIFPRIPNRNQTASAVQPRADDAVGAHARMNPPPVPQALMNSQPFPEAHADHAPGRCRHVHGHCRLVLHPQRGARRWQWAEAGAGAAGGAARRVVVVPWAVVCTQASPM
jgi:hypothetical protein